MEERRNPGLPRSSCFTTGFNEAEKALHITRNALKRAPLLIPVFNHCYITCNPCLAINPRRESHLLLWSGSL
uniref:Uncharacterized protein n=1 Tax=Nelumbo nucifera TaxID=4432 RepID=A0A822XB86_NELNU|nr:TPA_asm: hypothetical protein HUJ06_020137 [Nelumbo nucifera]